MASQLFIKYPRGTLAVDVTSDMPISQVKQRLSLQLPEVPVGEMRLIRGGIEMQDAALVSDYQLTRESTVHLIHRAPAATAATTTNTSSSTAAHSNSSSTTAATHGMSQWRRPVNRPLTLSSHALPEIAGDISRWNFFVWCSNDHHACGTDGCNTAYPAQMQPASARPRCASCKSDSVLVDNQTLTQWTDVFSRTVAGQCLNCNSRHIAYSFICQGALVTPVVTSDGRQLSVCKSESLHMHNVVLPNVKCNTEHIESIDSLDQDSHQVCFHPCNHRINANGLAQYIAQMRRDNIVENTNMPEVFGKYVLRCLSRDCTGVVYLPTCKLAGAQLHESVKNWGSVEAILQDGGILCPMDAHPGIRAFVPKPSEFGPQVFCSSCDMYICEEHAIPWSACPHSVVTPEVALRQRIEETLHLGMFNTCPACGLPGQKDGNCTHIVCNCGTTWCYFCGKSEAAADKGPPLQGNYADIWRHNYQYATNNRRCVLYLDQHELLAGTPALSLALYHRYRLMRLLATLRAQSDRELPGLFDRIYASFSPTVLAISIVLENDTCTLPPISIAEIVRGPPQSAFAMP
jgi:hypothetical protein